MRAYRPLHVDEEGTMVTCQDVYVVDLFIRLGTKSYKSGIRWKIE